MRSILNRTFPVRAASAAGVLALAVVIGGGSTASAAPPADPAPPGVPGVPAPAEPPKGLPDFTDCMRENGLPGFPDPKPGKLLKERPGLPDPRSADFRKAADRCAEFLPPKVALSEGQDPWSSKARLKYVACIRANGVPGLVSPERGGILLPKGVTPGSSRLKKAEAACAKHQPPGLVKR
ncbi:hypothetical protein [Nonomuraea longicatena]|uniref:Uncharacterized protein n=1 Tax=Nonomuraea longicatena TaxID=83682 RepID=A0ABP3ZPL2_9ACTN